MAKQVQAYVQQFKVSKRTRAYHFVEGVYSARKLNKAQHFCRHVQKLDEKLGFWDAAGYAPRTARMHHSTLYPGEEAYKQVFLLVSPVPPLTAAFDLL